MTTPQGPDADDDGTNEKLVSPSAFMRQLRPEHYSDSVGHTSYELDSAMLEFRLETVTARNETHEFEIFCRKLCERSICPNLRPATGPEGGGDSKADTETFPVADEIATLYYMGEANSGRERWGFAFSAKKEWGRKVRQDVAGLIATGRNYDRIFCVTTRSARDKARAKLEDVLSAKYKVRVTILDRSWIVKEVVEADRKDLAFNYLDVGREVADGARLGPSDYSRTQQLDDLEKAIQDPTHFDGMKLQLATEALVAAKLSRNLERPRIETDGRFERAIRLANAHGTHRQRLEANYERIWTGFWWFDDVAMLNADYDAFETLSDKTDYAIDVDFLCNLAQILFNAVIHRHLSAEEAKLEERIGRLEGRLAAMAADGSRPNNALHARMSLLQIEVNRAVLAQDLTRLPPIWPQLSEVLEKARGLGEFPAKDLTRLIEAFGMIAGKDAGYAHLVDRTSEFVSARKSEAEGALVLLTRAQQLGARDPMESIRLLGKAAYHLTKKEYASSLIDATRLLAVAYRGAGLLWAARASCVFSIAAIFIEAEEESELPVSVIPTLMIWAWISVEMRHLPDALEAVRLVNGCVKSRPLTNESQERVESGLQELDMVLASQVLNFSTDELAKTPQLPDVLAGLGLYHSHLALLYVLGHEALLRERGGVPEDMTSEALARHYTRLASQPASDNPIGAVIFNGPGAQTFSSRVLGIRIDVHHQGSETSILAAEAVVGSIEALFATTIGLEALPHAETFAITIEESPQASEPSFTMHDDRSHASVYWPAGLLPNNLESQPAVRDMLVQLAGTVFVSTCMVRDAKSTLKRFFEADSVWHRIFMVAVAGTSRTRVLKSGISRLSDWTALAKDSYSLEPERPAITRKPLARYDNGPIGDADAKPPRVSSHRELGVRSVIDVPLWDRAKWRGTAFLQLGPLPGIGLLFTNLEAGRKIFEHWRERFGEHDQQDDIYLAIVRGIRADKPAHYRVMITSRMPAEPPNSPGQGLMIIASRLQTMEPASDVNLMRFLDTYAKARRFVLAPVHLGPAGTPVPALDCAILKQALSVKTASEVGAHDIETIAVHSVRDSPAANSSGSE